MPVHQASCLTAHLRRCRRVYGLRQPPTPPREFIYSDRLFARTTRLIVRGVEEGGVIVRVADAGGGD